MIRSDGLFGPVGVSEGPIPLSNVSAPRSPHIKDTKSNLESTPAGRKLRQAAGEFESMLLSNLWKSMKSTFADSDDEADADPAHDSLEDWSIQTMSSAIGKAGGIGLGDLILKHLAPKLSAEPAVSTLDIKPSGPLADKYP